MTLPGALYLLMSEKASCEKFTPTSGPGGVLAMPGGKCCCTMSPGGARTEGVVVAAQKRGGAGFGNGLGHERIGGTELVFSAQTPSTQPSRSVSAMTALVWSGERERPWRAYGLCDDRLHVGQRELREPVTRGRLRQKSKLRKSVSPRREDKRLRVLKINNFFSCHECVGTSQRSVR
jgi:hypothetical protein